MRFHHFSIFSSRTARRTTLILATILLAGCSSNTMRFADGMFTNSTSGKQSSNRPMPQQPIPPSVNGSAQTASVNGSAQTIESNALPPIEPAPSPEPPTQVAGLGSPPRNLGTLPASEVKEPAATPAQGRYIVQSGDTLSRIAARQGVRVAALREANALKGDVIRIGQVLTIPSASPSATLARTTNEPVVHQAATTTNVATNSVAANAASATTPSATAIAKQPTARSSETPSGNAIKTPADDGVKATGTEQQTAKIDAAPQASGIATLRWPAKGRILSSFGQREGASTNDGVDIMVPEGSVVKAAENGVVIYAGDGLKEFGNTILIRHEDNLVTVYGHNSQLLVQRGQKVRRGDEIAKSGKSGNTTTPKLHFEVRKNSTPVNPMKYLES